MPPERSLPRDRRSNRLGTLEVNRVTRARDDLDEGAGYLVSHRLRDLTELLVTLADDQQHGNLELTQAVPHRWQRTRPEPTKRPREPLRGVAQSIGSDPLSDLRRLVGQYGRSRPARRELLNGHLLDVSRELLVGVHTGRSLGGIRDSGSRPDQDEPYDPRRSREGVLQRDTTPHRVAREHKPARHEPIEV